ncbi:MAG: alpha/beta hydrolase, partial [Kofleriaceae bacterium]
IAGTYLQGYRVQQQIAACHVWPQGAIPPAFHAPVTSDVPILLISGPYDPVTPPRFADQVAPHLSHGLQILVPQAHHGSGGLSHADCLHTITTTFLEHGTTAGLDTSCVATMQRPPFVTDAAGFAAVLKSFGG